MALCIKCGREIMDGSQFCPHCGERVGLTPPSNPSAPVSDEEFAAFIGNNSLTYIQKFRKFSKGGPDGFALTWNWPAFIMGSGWMFYRKLYFWSFVAFLLSIIPPLSLFAWIGFGLAGNYLYYRHSKRTIIDIRAMHPSSDISAHLAQAGGVNKWIVTFSIALAVIIVIIFIAFVLLHGPTHLIV